MEETLLILVDESDNETGIAEKMEVHRNGLLHRAISVFIVNSSGEWILQKRALDKYHSMGLWTNTCCTHPAPGESNIDAAHRRLEEEMGLKCELSELFSFVYREDLDNELVEYEFDHVFFGITNEKPEINRAEVDEWKYIPFAELHDDILTNPDRYTYWFKHIYTDVNEHIISNKT